jgi:glycosyltransferase involved in cell wall biosynthesis
MRRPLGFVRYLRQYNWEPVVVTVEERFHNFIFIDTESMNKVPAGVEIYRTKLPFEYFQRFASPYYQSSQKVELKKTVLRAWYMNVRKCLKKFNFLVPDSIILWLPYVVRLLISNKKIRRIDVVFSTSPPESVAVIGFIVSRLLGVPHIVDFRDAWTKKPSVYPQKGRIKSALGLLMERFILKRASAVICVTDTMKKDYIKAYPWLRNKIITVTNGFDKSDMNVMETITLPKGSFVYTGFLFPERSPYPFLSGLKELLEEGLVKRQEVKIYLVGIIWKEPEEMVEELGLQDVVLIKEQVSHRESIAFQKAADVLLLFGTGSPCEMTGKIFEYLASGRFIFALSRKGGEIDELLKKTGAGIVVDCDDKDSIKKAFFDIVVRLRAGLLYSQHKLNNGVIAQYSRISLTGQLARVFGTVVTAK